jgi:hypothetical protein
MIAAESGCCLRPLGIVLNEQVLADDFQLTPSSGMEPNVWFSYRYLFIHYEPFWSSSCAFGSDYPRSGSATKDSPTHQLINNCPKPIAKNLLTGRPHIKFSAGFQNRPHHITGITPGTGHENTGFFRYFFQGNNLTGNMGKWSLQ